MFPPLPFPALAVCVSAVLDASGLWLILSKSRRRDGNEPRCNRCDYLQLGLTSDRCPECGEPILAGKAQRGRKRRSSIRVVGGLVVLIASPTMSWKAVARWMGSVYWYPYRTDSQLIHDLKNGFGLPAPANNPLETFLSHGWITEQVDLSRVALHELLKRDAAGTLSPAHRHEIDEIALANLYAPVTGPTRYYLDDELARRLWAGKLTSQERTTIFNRAVTLTATAQPVVAQWDPVPIHLVATTCLPSGVESRFTVDLTYSSVRIDGKEASW